MIFVKSVTINKFRAFHPGENFELGEGVTLIAGLNGTAKSTLLGMICQPIGFPTTDKKSLYTNAYHDVSLKERRTLFGTPFKTSISEVFRFSRAHDKPRQHDYIVRLKASEGVLSTMVLDRGLSVRSEARGGAEADKLRIVTNSDLRDPGAGNFPHPVIYLGLDRLRPLSTVDTVKMNTGSQLTESEKRIWCSIYSEVMLCNSSEHISSSLLDTEKTGKGKYESVSAESYDGESASAGQDNLSQIITALLSFYRLKSDLGGKYQGGVLLIDEIDATLHPFSQVALLDRLVKYSEELKIQIIATTHSLYLLEMASRKMRNSIRLLFLERREDGAVYLVNDCSYDDMSYRLSLVRAGERLPHKKRPKVTVLFEDIIASYFFKCVTKNVFKEVVRVYSTDGKNNETSLSNNILSSVARYIAPKKIPEFSEVIYVLDADSKSLTNKKTKNLLCLPGEACVEEEIYALLKDSSDLSFKVLTRLGTTHAECFIGFNDVKNDPLLKNDQMRKAKYKEWFRKHRKDGLWGVSCSKVFSAWRDAHAKECMAFCKNFLDALCAACESIGIDEKNEMTQCIEKKFHK